MTAAASVLLCATLATATPATSASSAPPAAAASSADRAAPPRRHFWLPPAEETGWTATDKKLHVLASYGAVLSFRLVEDDSGAAAASAAALGVAKELSDALFRPPGPTQGASWHDLVADAVGIAAGLAVWAVFAP